jgi:outer membrane lipoprotein SlyB
MKTNLAIACLSLTLIAGAAHAGCLGGAVVGGVAGHVAGHHGLAGAAAGCVVGHEMAVHKKKELAAKKAASKAQLAHADAAAHPAPVGAR